MSSDHFECLSTGSTLSPISLTPRLSNSGFSLASAPSSVVQTGVKSLGCENSIAQELPIQSWNLIGPSVVFASKSGAVSPIANVIFPPSGTNRTLLSSLSPASPLDVAEDLSGGDGIAS